jgi:hypothetical protein
VSDFAANVGKDCSMRDAFLLLPALAQKVCNKRVCDEKEMGG